jgi:hypothetical protein
MQLIAELTARKVRAAAQAALGTGLAFAGISHLTLAREEFRAQVPTWVPLDTELVVLASGVVEIALGGGLLATWAQPRRALVGATVAAFFVAVFPATSLSSPGIGTRSVWTATRSGSCACSSSRCSWPGPSMPPTPDECSPVGGAERLRHVAFGQVEGRRSEAHDAQARVVDHPTRHLFVATTPRRSGPAWRCAIASTCLRGRRSVLGPQRLGASLKVRYPANAARVWPLPPAVPPFQQGERPHHHPSTDLGARATRRRNTLAGLPNGVEDSQLGVRRDRTAASMILRRTRATLRPQSPSGTVGSDARARANGRGSRITPRGG